MNTNHGMDSLQRLLQREQQLCEEAQAALRHSAEAARRARDQHAQLLAYRADYEARWAAQFQQGGTMDILRCYRSFMQRLDQAVVLQARQADGAEAQLERARQALLDNERRAASVRKLIERRIAEQAPGQRRREQRQTDEQAQRMRWNRAQQDQPLPH